MVTCKDYFCVPPGTTLQVFLPVLEGIDIVQTQTDCYEVIPKYVKRLVFP